MDDIDFTISLLLMANSRRSYRELAEMFKMSVNSIYKRIKSMVDLGIIEIFNHLFFIRNLNYSVFLFFKNIIK